MQILNHPSKNNQVAPWLRRSLNIIPYHPILQVPVEIPNASQRQGAATSRLHRWDRDGSSAASAARHCRSGQSLDGSGLTPWFCKVLPQLGIAKLVNIAPISLWCMCRYIEPITRVYKPSFNLGAPPCGKMPKHCLCSLVLVVIWQSDILQKNDSA